MTTKPNDAKPSDSILGPLNLTLAGGWELGSIQQVLIAMLRREDEHLADSSNEGMGSPGISRVEEAALAKPESTCHHHRYTQDCPQCAYTPVVDEAIGERDALKSKLASVEAANRSLSAQLTMWQDAASKRESALAEANARAERLEGELADSWDAGYERGYDDREKMDHDRADVVRSENPHRNQSAGLAAPSQPLQDAQPVEDAVVGASERCGECNHLYAPII